MIDGKLIVVLGGFIFLFFNFFGIIMELFLIFKLFLFLFSIEFVFKFNGLFSYKFNIGVLIDNMVLKLFLIGVGGVDNSVYIDEMKFKY